MDRHYEMVMEERAKANATPRQYFAYSTILDPEAYAEWRSQHGYDFFQLPAGEVACALDVTLAYDFPSRFWGGRVAGLVDAPGKKVCGKLFSIAGTDWPIIRHKEGGITEMSVERPVQVSCAGKVIPAVAFETNPRRRSTHGEISPHFRAALVAGAKAAGLPADWVTELSSLS